MGRGSGPDGPLQQRERYIRDLIRRDQERAKKIAHLQRLVSEGLASGEGRRSMDELRAAARATLDDGLEPVIS